MAIDSVAQMQTQLNSPQPMKASLTITAKWCTASLPCAPSPSPLPRLDPPAQINLWIVPLWLLGLTSKCPLALRTAAAKNPLWDSAEPTPTLLHCHVGISAALGCKITAFQDNSCSTLAKRKMPHQPSHRTSHTMQTNVYHNQRTEHTCRANGSGTFWFKHTTKVCLQYG